MTLEDTTLEDTTMETTTKYTTTTPTAPLVVPAVEEVASAFSALGSEARLEVLRLLVRAGDNGLTVGEIQSSLAIPASTLSHHLRHLTAAGLLTQVRTGREIRCASDYKRIRALSQYLLLECCADQDCWEDLRSQSQSATSDSATSDSTISDSVKEIRKEGP